jgi:hypothetical protein
MNDIDGILVNGPSLAEERWRILDKGDRWSVWSIPLNHPERWRELTDFASEQEANEYLLMP